MIEYKSTKQNTELPEIQGYKKQFSINIPRGDEEKTEDIQKPEVQQETPIQQEIPVQQENTPSEWSDIKSIIKKNEGFMSSAKSVFNEPSASIGYGFFGSLPDGRKIYSGMTMTRAEADKQLDIAINKLSSQVQNYLNKYNIQTSPEQFNVLLDLGYHGGAGLVDKLLKESGGDTSKIGSLLTRYATTAKYGDTSISNALRKRAMRRSEGWNKYILKGKNGLKIPKFQKGGLSPEVINTTLMNLRQKIADSKWGPKIAQELGIKQKEVVLPDGSKVPIVGGIGIMGLLNSEAWEGLEYAEIAKEAIGYNKQILKIPKWEKTVIGYEGPIKKIRTGEEKHQSFLKGLNTYTKNRYKSEFNRLHPNEQARIETEYRRIINNKQKPNSN